MRSRAGWDSPRQLHHEGCDGLGCGKISRRREPILECPFPADVAENVQFGMERQSRAREKIIILECGHFASERWPTLRKRSILFADLPRSRMRPDQLPLASFKFSLAQRGMCRCHYVRRRSNRDERWCWLDVNGGCNGPSRCKQIVPGAHILSCRVISRDACSLKIPNSCGERHAGRSVDVRTLRLDDLRLREVCWLWRFTACQQHARNTNPDEMFRAH